MQVVPEYESCHEAAERAGVSVRDVHIAGWVGASPKLESPESDWNREGIDHGIFSRKPRYPVGNLAKVCRS